jgi:hypothetical protein
MDTADDRKAIQSVINKIVFYPLKDFESRPEPRNAPTLQGFCASSFSGRASGWPR